MGNFNFGFITNALEVGRHADANIYTGPDNSPMAAAFDQDFTNIVANADKISTIYGASTDFIWGQKWGSPNKKVTK